MKVKFQTLTAFVSLVALTNVAFAGTLVMPTSSINNQSGFNVVTPTQGNLLTNATILTDGTVISNSGTTSSPIKMDIADNDQSVMSYHNSGGGEGIANKNIVYVGIGPLSLTSLFASAFKDEGYSSSVVPDIDVAYERGLSSHFGLGVLFEYTSVSLSVSGTDYDYNSGNSYTYTDKATISDMGFGISAAYHFGSSNRIDPFMCWALGYEIIGYKFTTNDPLYGTSISNVAPSFSYSGGLPMFNMFFGCRFFITDNIGLYVDAGWHGLFGSLLNLGVAAKF